MELIRRLAGAHDVIRHADAADWAACDGADASVTPRAFPLADGSQVGLQLGKNRRLGIIAEGFVDLSYFLARKPRHED